ncbi:serine protease [Methylotuvimicrobium buryatense]|uniref:Serine protease n=3 Tax=Methylococcaceae TaxID=403 RepID=G4T2N0_META2|nr:serine protease [Methylotuvimicrobium buryatense]CCE22514.1 exported protein of unknown function [Methylotuvimicrobium alcaliphilum 20Z]
MSRIRSVGLFWFSIGLFCSSQACAIEPDMQLSLSVVKVIARDAAGKTYMGSGVIIAPGKVATNCHVTRNAEQIVLFKSGHAYPVLKQAALTELDACILETDSIPLPAAKLALSADFAVGTPVYMYGYPFALGMRSRPASIVAFHPYRAGHVLEIDAGFMQGASGGGIFNEAGELVGLMTFIGKDGNDFHYYVIPADWLLKAAQAPFVAVHAFKGLSFWESGSFKPETKY